MSIGRLAGTSVFTAIAASLCCITPVLALIAGSGSVAASFSWIEPARPYLIGLTVAVLGFAWYQKLRERKQDECGCEVRKPFIQSKLFLLIITLFAALMITFPSYASVFFPKNKTTTAVVTDNSKLQTIQITIKGMTCEACEIEVNQAVQKLSGILKVETSYEKRNTVVQFDAAIVSSETIIEAVRSTGYKVINHTIKN